MLALLKKYLPAARAFLKENLLKGVLLVVITGVAVGWLKELISSMLPGTETPRCWIEEQWQAAFANLPGPDPGHFTVLITRLARDPNESETTHLIDAFRGEQGFRRLTTCRVVTLQGEDRNLAEQRAGAEADRLRAARGADLVLWGEVADRGALRVWITGPRVRADLKTRPWVVDKGELEPAFKENFALALQAMTWGALAPTQEGGMFGTAYLLRPLLPRLRNLIKDLPVGLSADAKGSLLSAAALGFFSYGMQARDTRSLHEAIAASRLALGEWVREHEAVQWAETQINLGLALTWVGRLEHVTEPVEGAVAAFRAALEELSRVRMPLGWALAQMDLGLALMTLGQLGNATEPLEQAVAAFRAALEELPRDRQPTQRAMTQNNLGLALMTLGRLEEAVTTLHEALEELPRDRQPILWAMTQNNLGLALLALGEREKGTARINEAVTCFRKALEELTRARSPPDWAATESYLGIALMTLGQLGNATEPLVQAVAAFRTALEELPRDRQPIERAKMQINLGLALMSVGERGSGTVQLNEAVAAYDEALALLVSAKEDDLAKIRSLRDNALALLAKRKE